jgi:predicted RNA-binding Zn-ribbon protein involved in translation (DUF1610 family)
MTDEYCAACGQRLTEQDIDGRLRQVCPACGRIH